MRLLGGNEEDLIGNVFRALRRQERWKHKEWGIDAEMQKVLVWVLSLPLCNSAEREGLEEVLRGLLIRKYRYFLRDLSWPYRSGILT